MKSARPMLWTALFLLSAIPLLAQNPAMVADINTTSSGGVPGSAFLNSGQPLTRAVVNNVLYLAATDGVTGWEIWKSASPYTGAALVKDLKPGSGNGVNGGQYIAAGGKLYFIGGDATSICDGLGKSDGTAQGTGIVIQGCLNNWSKGLGSPVESQGLIFAKQFVQPRNFECSYDDIWTYNPSSGSSKKILSLDRLEWMVHANGTLVHLYRIGKFSLCGAPGHPIIYYLAKSNGTTKGTVTYFNLGPWWSASVPDNHPYRNMETRIVANGTTVYFPWGDTAYGNELWKTDGTTAGTMRVTDINPGAGNSLPSMAALMGGYLYFAANDGTHGYQIWRLPLGGGAAERVTDIDGGTTGAEPMWLTPLGSSLYFSAYTPDNGRELWVSNGLPVGNGGVATMVADINTGSASSNPHYPNLTYNGWDLLYKFSMPVIDGWIYFPADDGTGYALWRSNGTTTEKIGGANPRMLTPVNGKLLFVGYDAEHGNELWKFDPALPFPKRDRRVSAVTPERISLAQNYPNPANPATTIRYALSEEMHVTLKVYDVCGREVATIMDGVRQAGEHSLAFDATNLPSGIYALRLAGGGRTLVRLMTVVK